MFGFSSPRCRPRRPIWAKVINRPADQVARQSRSRPGGAISAIEAAGSMQEYSTTRKTWLIRITAVGTSPQAGQYSWQAIYPVPGTPGTYADLTGWKGSLGGDAFYEANATANLVVGDRVEVYRDWYTGQVRGQFSHC